jgi:outer membrane protein assembly factor BamE (lipoprotein component of BamABCDE complex)
MRTALSILAMILFISLMAGCATNAGGYKTPTEVVNRLNGMSKEDLAMKLGAPTESQILSDSEVWTYRGYTAGLRGGQCIITAYIKNGYVVSSNVKAFDLSPLAAPLGSCSCIIGNLD